ncbi:hypothetical protein C9374_011448 [Naegleria lovaniensis]|uniref:Uncharacterized protein n=1 Tax=Naegleria lovaniensis TaxID=51637 RepID=A0AA88KP24_NAELO|nr:uncharacterized protein C9374_011448 [Naegleria lovaniensis]KAG2392723.1 hypothetical protein C9374_011448 [Naegleria lovaniensis]
MSNYHDHHTLLILEDFSFIPMLSECLFQKLRRKYIPFSLKFKLCGEMLAGDDHVKTQMNDLIVDAKNEKIYVVGVTPFIHVYDYQTKHFMYDIQISQNTILRALALDHNENSLIAGADFLVKYDLTHKKILWTLIAPHISLVCAMTVNKFDGTIYITCFREGVVVVSKAGKVLTTFSQDCDGPWGIQTIHAVDNSNYLIISNFWNRNLVVFKQRQANNRSIEFDTLRTFQLDEFFGVRGLFFDEWNNQLFVCDEQAARIHIFSLPKNGDFVNRANEFQRKSFEQFFHNNKPIGVSMDYYKGQLYVVPAFSKRISIYE